MKAKTTAVKTKTWLAADAFRTSEVARQATEIQQQTGCSRSEALRIAEQRIPHVKIA